MGGNPSREINRLYTLLLVAGLIIAALVLFLIATQMGDGAWKTVFEQVAGTVIVASLLTVFWEARGRQALAGEVFEVANLGHDVQRAGLYRVNDNYTTIQWAELFKADKIDVYLGLGRTWFSNHSAALEDLAKRPGVRLRVVLADPTDDAAVECMAERFTRSAERVREDIRYATDALTGSLTRFPGHLF
jgi:hypothetical protein